MRSSRRTSKSLEPRRVHKLLDRFPGKMYLSSFIALETLATFAYHVRDGRLTPARYRKLRREFTDEFPAIFNLIAVKEQTVSVAMALADTHRKIGAGSMDLLHVATALQAREALTEAPLTIVCADRSLRLVAQAAGFPVFNPETDDLADLDSRSN